MGEPKVQGNPDDLQTTGATQQRVARNSEPTLLHPFHGLGPKLPNEQPLQ